MFTKLKNAALGALRDLKGKLGLIGAAALGVASVGGTRCLADATPPIDFTATATTIAGYLPTAAAAGLIIFAVWFGVAMIKRVFLTVA